MHWTEFARQLAKITPKHLPRFPEPKFKLLGGRRPNYAYYVADHDRKIPHVWKLNTQVKEYKSQLLDKTYRVLVTTRVMKTIDKKGGLDNYILDTSDQKLDSEIAIEVKKELLQTITSQQKSAFRDPELVNLPANPPQPSASA
jgi:large subunit ribosomal protein L28